MYLCLELSRDRFSLSLSHLDQLQNQNGISAISKREATLIGSSQNVSVNLFVFYKKYNVLDIFDVSNCHVIEFICLSQSGLANIDSEDANRDPSQSRN